MTQTTQAVAAQPALRRAYSLGDLHRANPRPDTWQVGGQAKASEKPVAALKAPTPTITPSRTLSDACGLGYGAQALSMRVDAPGVFMLMEKGQPKWKVTVHPAPSVAPGRLPELAECLQALAALAEHQTPDFERAEFTPGPTLAAACNGKAWDLAAAVKEGCPATYREEVERLLAHLRRLGAGQALDITAMRAPSQK